MVGHPRPKEEEEYWRLLKREDLGRITPRQRRRFEDLSDLLWPRLEEYYAGLPEPTAENDLWLYAQEIADRMRARVGQVRLIPTDHGPDSREESDQ
ncbi:MAG TPA: hypothetical protein VFZ97_06755 [Acidimicrobiales bacterium]